MRFLKPAIGILTAVCLTSSMCIGSVFAAETIIDTSVGSEDEEVIQADYATFLEYDSSPMKAGETRTVRFYNPALPTMTKMTAYEVSENISYVYEEGSDTFTITALTPGKARMYIMGEGCAFGCYLNIDVVDDTLTTTTTTTIAGAGTTTTTTTTTAAPDDELITTSTAIADYRTFLEYDSSPMRAGETRTVRFYNPGLPTMTKMTAYEVSENISYVYEEGSDTLTITALAPGNARMYIMGEGCAFGCYLNIEVVDNTLTTTTTTVAGAGTTTTTTTTTAAPDDEQITTSTAIADYRTFLEYDSSPMKAGETRTVRFYNPGLPTMTKMTAYEVSENISYVYEEGSDTLTITALTPGKARMYIMGEGCAFGCYLNIEVVDDTLTTTTTTVAGAGTTTTTTTTVAGEGTTTTTTTTIADEETTTTTTVINNDEELPQTGYSNIYKVIAGFATLMTIGGASLVVKTRKENE